MNTTTATNRERKQLETGVDWRRLAEPQFDLYDSEVALALAGSRGLSIVKAPSTAWAFDRQVPVLENHFWDGSQFSPAAVDDINIFAGWSLIRSWPAIFSQCQSLLSAVFVSHIKGADPHIWGSCSGPAPSGLGAICVTASHPVGFAEAVVHEVAHWKLRAIGIDFTSASRLLTNSPDQMFQSPIRYDKLRPMSAVLHAQYSYTYVVALDLALVHGDCSFSEDIVTRSVALYVPKLRFGLETLRRGVRTDPDGSHFMAGFYDWSERVLSDAYSLLHQRGVTPVAFAHPLQESERNT